MVGTSKKTAYDMQFVQIRQTNAQVIKRKKRIHLGWILEIDNPFSDLVKKPKIRFFLLDISRETYSKFLLWLFIQIVVEINDADLSFMDSLNTSGSSSSCTTDIMSNLDERRGWFVPITSSSSIY